MDFTQMALKMALLSRPQEEELPPPPIDLAPVLDELSRMRVALESMRKSPRAAAAP